MPWLAYLLAGMALGRLDLSRRRVQCLARRRRGRARAWSRPWCRALLTGPAGIADDLARLTDGAPAATGPELLDEIAGGMFGNTPTGGPWEWLLVVAPHSTTPFDLAQTIGSALLVIGALPAPGRRRCDASGVRTVAIVFGAGTMTLSLYTLHVVMRTEYVLPEETPSSFPCT